MKISDQVTSLELSKRLHELGITEPSYFIWITAPFDKSRARLMESSGISRTIYPPDYGGYYAYTVAELGMMLPGNICFNNFKNYLKQTICNAWWEPHLESKSDIHQNCSFQSDTEADCRAKALIYCIVNALVKVEDINTSLNP